MAVQKKAKVNKLQLRADCKREVFARAFIANGGNGTQAAIEAGWCAKTAHVTACNQLKNAKVRAIIEAHAKKVADKIELKTENVLLELRKIVHADIRQLFNANGSLKDISEWPDNVACAVSSLEINELYEGQGKERKQIGFTKKLKLWDKNAAIEKAMKHLGLFERDNEQSKANVTLVLSNDDADL